MEIDESGQSGVRKVILVLSGKGGVGKSTCCTQLALCLGMKGLKVGLLDVDLCGPSIPRMLNVGDEEVLHGDEGWLPVQRGGIKVMSIGFLMKNKDEAVVWRGPKKHAMIKQFLMDVVWGDLDYLLIDTPPGTSDEHMSLVEILKEQGIKMGAVLVTTPQNVATGDVRREITFCRQANVPMLGIVENMSGFVCPTCSDCTNIFSSGGGEKLAQLSQIAFLGRVPIEPQLAKSLECGQSYIEAFSSSETAKVFQNVAQQVEGTLV